MRRFRWWWMVIWFFWFGRVVCKLCVILIFYALQCIKTFLNSHKFLCVWYFEGGIGGWNKKRVEDDFEYAKIHFLCIHVVYVEIFFCCSSFSCGTSIVCILKKSEKWDYELLHAIFIFILSTTIRENPFLFDSIFLYTIFFIFLNYAAAIFGVEHLWCWFHNMTHRHGSFIASPRYLSKIKIKKKMQLKFRGDKFFLGVS